MKHRISALLFGTALALCASAAVAQDKNVKIGVLTDNSGLYSDLGGAGSTLAAQMAIEDSGLAAKGWKVDLISADHQNKPDIATTIARQWIDVEKVDILMDVLNSGVGLAVNNVVKEKNSIMINTGAATSDLTNAQCSPNTIHWVYDTYMLANSTGQALVKAGGDTWFFLTADYAFGAALERDTTAVIVKSGGNRPRKPRSSAWPMPAATPPIRSSRRRNSASSRAARSLPVCCCSSPTFTRSV
jgi:branched-chain amino acid transport system substrate-binding protein